MDLRQGDDFLKIKRAVLQADRPYYYFRKVKPEQSFKLKKSFQEVVSEIFSLEELLKAVERAPPEAIIFHLHDKNDFADWIEKIIGNEELGEKISQIKLTRPEETRWKLVGILYNALVTQFYSDHLR